MNNYLNHLIIIANEDVHQLRIADESYGSSWKKRGGVGAYMMSCRKFDRIETALSTKYNYDIFRAIVEDKRPNGIIDDIRDLRRYLMLIEAEMIDRGIINATPPVPDPK